MSWTQRQTSLDRTFSQEVSYTEVDRYDELAKAATSAPHLIAQGAGISYAPLSFGGSSTTLSLKQFDRILSFDPHERMIEVEAGIPLAKIYDFLSPRGLYLSIQPGHPQISVGGCIAVNIHGKNQYTEGLFESQVESLILFHPAQGRIELSRTKNAEIFFLTCGGMGLTGIILSAKLRVKTLPGSHVEAENIPTNSLADTIGQLEKLKDQFDLLYSWNDLSVFGKSMGRGFITCGKFVSLRQKPREDEKLHYKILKSTRSLPSGVCYYNRATIWGLGQAYQTLNLKLKPKSTLELSRFNYPVLDKTFYFDWFGSHGFIERQMLIPKEQLTSYLPAFEALVHKLRPEVALCTCKIFRGQGSLLNYNGTGISLSLDVLRTQTADLFHAQLDALNIQHHVIDNLAKDSRVSHETAFREYAGFSEFKSALLKWDPKRTFQSELSRRIEV